MVFLVLATLQRINAVYVLFVCSIMWWINIVVQALISRQFISSVSI